MKKFFTILVLVLIFGGLAFSAGLTLLTDSETECKYLVPSSSQSYVHPVLLSAGKPDCWRK